MISSETDAQDKVPRYDHYASTSSSNGDAGEIGKGGCGGGGGVRTEVSSLFVFFSNSMHLPSIMNIQQSVQKDQ